MGLSPVTRLIAVLLLVLLPAPLLIVIGASFSPRAVLSFPPNGFSWRWYAEFLGSAAWVTAFGRSALIAVLAAVLTTLISLAAALALDRAPARLRGAVETAILAPLLFPHAAIGIAFLGWLALLHLNGGFAGVLLAHLILCAPFAYRPIAVSLRQIDRSLTEAATILGATPPQAVRLVVLPLLRPGIAAALLFSFIISFDEVTVTMFLVGPEFTTLPVSIYAHIHDSADPVVAAISSILILLTALLVLLIDRLVGLRIFIDIEEEGRHAPA
ncbi:ABC transporter permease [Siccirubricoccus phaeus]|uniref:ABC transporter permease n=1 Tax=Siccirubricoccus phaeus TaxID=2595053 RepID=UPI0011F34AC7|nr:ABC transporter permease [Siccirubricoccus phaeus]